MEKRICVAAVGDNCMDCYDDLGQSFPGGNPVKRRPSEMCTGRNRSDKCIQELQKELTDI